MLRDHPGLASCAVPCRHCGIRFLTHPRNANRQDLLCEFGCREHHRRQQANERSKRHYRTDQGRRNKKRLNGKRSAAAGGGVSPDSARPGTAVAVGDSSSGDPSSAVEGASPRTPHATHEPTPVATEEAPDVDVRLTLEGLVLDEATLVNSSLLPYLAMVASVIEGRSISAAELLQGLRRSMRQRSIGRRARREYVLAYLNQHPP